MTNAPAGELSEIPRGSYLPSGGTALRDAIGVTIDTLTRECLDGDADFLVIVITDGEDTSSSINQSHIAEKIQTMKSKGWTFTYLGTDKNLEVARAMNISNVAGFSGPAGVKGMVGPHGRIGKKSVDYASARVSAGLNSYLCRATMNRTKGPLKAFDNFFDDKRDRAIADEMNKEDDS